jgi:hypothetical protein
LYLTRNDAIEILKNMREFENALNETYTSRGYNFRDNTGRRNQLLSVAQEVETAKVLRKKYKEVIEDGAPGKPDIYIKDIDKELECKLTSGSKSKGTISYAFQTDWATLCAKKKLDYLYIVADKQFDEYCVIFFDGLTPDDFFPPASGSRGKSRMNKTVAMKKATFLYGSFTLHNDVYIKTIREDFVKENEEHFLKIRSLHKRIGEISDPRLKKFDKLIGIKERETDRHRAKVKKLSDRLKYWRESPHKYGLNLEGVSSCQNQ